MWTIAEDTLRREPGYLGRGLWPRLERFKTLRFRPKCPFFEGLKQTFRVGGNEGWVVQMFDTVQGPDSQDRFCQASSATLDEVVMQLDPRAASVVGSVNGVG